ncbi:sensor histidine kinase [Mycolicibacterium sp. XJ870]
MSQPEIRRLADASVRPYHVAIRAIADFFRRRFDGEVSPLGYPWGVGIAWHAGLWIVAAVAIIQRGADPLGWTIVAGLLVVAPTLVFLARGTVLMGFPLAATTLSATAVFIWTHPVEFDIAPLIPGFALGAIAVQLSSLATVGIAVAYSAVLVGAQLTDRIDGVVIFLVLMVVSLLIHHMLKTQQRLIAVEQQAKDSVREHATSEERRRIAREVHDVVAHSMSITLLHLTAARHGLQQQADVSEVISALVDAERIGRTAMTDIRRTIGLLETGPASATSQPSIDDIIGLIHDFEVAGLVLDYQINGTTDHVSPSTGLAVYRICQEALANVVKHAPQAKADMLLDISPSSIVVSISNDSPRSLTGKVRGADDGRGISGMKQRAELLGGSVIAGRHRSHWTVEARIPLATYQSEVRDQTAGSE